jgi:hypothetical protein
MNAQGFEVNQIVSLNYHGRNMTGIVIHTTRTSITIQDIYTSEIIKNIQTISRRINIIVDR